MEHFLPNLSQGNMKSMTTDKGCLVAGISEKSTISSINILDLKPGQSFRGEIIAVNGEEVQLFLAKNQYLTARLEGQVQLALGQNLLFQVQSNKDAKIVLKPVYESAFQLHVNESALKAANLPINDKNIQLVSAMIENGLPIDKGTLSVFYRQILQNPRVCIEDLVKMNKLQIPLTQENVRQFESYKNFQNSLSEAINEVANDIVQLYDNAYDKSTVAEKYITEILNFFDENENYYQVQETENKFVIAKNDKEISIYEDNLKEKHSNEPHVQVVAEEEPKMRQNPQTSMLAKSTETIIQILKSKNIDVQNQILNLTDNDSDYVKNVNNMKIIADILKELPIDEKKSIFSNQLFKDFLKESLKDLWSLSPNEVSDADKIQELYERIIRQSKKIAQIVDETVIEGQAPSKAINNLRENIEFINQINHTFQYVQLPLKFSNQNANGEVFVYANKKSLAQNGENLSAILHLELQYLGKVDVKIQLYTKQNYVTTNFLVNSDMIFFLEEHLTELNERLENLGFRSKVNVLEREEAKTVIDEMEELALNGKISLSYQAFDMRT